MSRRSTALIVAVVAALLLPTPVHAVSPRPSCGGITAEHLSDPACDAEMAANPAPNVQPVPVGTLYPRRYAQVAEWTPVYNAPGGESVRFIKRGYVFVSIDPTHPDGQEEWIKINYGEWVRADRLTRVRPSSLTGVLIPGPLPYPMAWVLLDTYCSAYPGGPPQRDQLVYRYARVNIFATVHHNGWNWYLIGPNRWIQQQRVGIVKHARNPGVSGRWIAVDLYEQIVTAYEGDRMIFAALTATGTSQWPTRVGLFSIERRHEFDDMTSGRYSTKTGYYYIEDVPWTMYFDGYAALHGVYWHDAFGFQQSHGCINLSLTDAQWLFNWTASAPQAPVLVWSSG